MHSIESRECHREGARDCWDIMSLSPIALKTYLLDTMHVKAGPQKSLTLIN
jgi:hypothetical protein